MPWQAWKVEWALSQASNQTGPCEWTWKSTGGEWKERESTSGAGPTMHGCAVERALMGHSFDFATTSCPLESEDEISKLAVPSYKLSRTCLKKKLARQRYSTMLGRAVTLR
jgi:hypothetical protein